jgi:hypothetical protein
MHGPVMPSLSLLARGNSPFNRGISTFARNIYHADKGTKNQTG